MNMKIRGLDFNIQISGEGTPFIWAHGLMLSMEGEDTQDWFRWNDFPRDRKLVRYDARGHGQSQPSYNPEDYDYRNLGKDMLAVADAVGAERFMAGGASMGCATTIWAALQSPERMKALVLMVPGTAWETRAAYGKNFRRLAYFGGLVGGRRLAAMSRSRMDQMLPAWLNEADPKTYTGTARGLSALEARTLWNALRGIAASDLPPRKELEALADIPAIILAWVGDRTHPVSTAQELNRLWPKSELFIAQGYEDLKTVPQRIRGFVSGIE
jgi:pimeloyl-ACP methyl ester carboxylesterase